ncbi:MAG: phage major tail tube protein [Rubrivivax sp.]|nr:MAG: phage major tail tube protein [Rubrivivax sp.]
MTLPRKLKNFVLFNAGESYLGEVPEVTLPKLTRKTEDYRAGGMNGPIKLDMGMEGLEFQWKAAGYIRTLLQQWGALKHDGVQLRFAGALQADDEETAKPLEIVMRGRHTEIDFGTTKSVDPTEISITSALTYYKLTLDGVVLIEIDLVNMVEVINGEDLLASVRAALGI